MPNIANTGSARNPHSKGFTPHGWIMKNTKKIEGRRELRFSKLDDLLPELDAIAANPDAATLGNWTAAQNLDHLARPLEWCMDGFPAEFKPPLMLKITGPILRSGLLRKGISAGIKPPPSMDALVTPSPDTPLDAALQRLRDALARFKDSPTIPKHPFLGPMDKATWETFHCRHAELHLSFIQAA